MFKSFTIIRTKHIRGVANISTEKEFDLGINIGYDKVKDTKYVWCRIFLPVITFIFDVNW